MVAHALLDEEPDRGETLAFGLRAEGLDQPAARHASPAHPSPEGAAGRAEGNEPDDAFGRRHTAPASAGSRSCPKPPSVPSASPAPPGERSRRGSTSQSIATNPKRT